MTVNQKIGVSICVLTYNRSLLLRNLLSSLQSLQYDPLEIIVVDNHSEDATQAMITTQFRGIEYVRTDENIGAAARNIGLKKAAGEIIITLDDDITGIDDNCITNLVKLFANRLKLGAVNFRVVSQSTGRICNWVHHCETEKYCNKEFLTYEITEGAVAFRRAALEDSGYYPESFFLSYEGPDLAFRMIDCGYEVIYSSSVSVIHSQSNLGRKEWFNYYYDTRNQLWFVARNLPFFYGMKHLLRGIPSMLLYSIRGGFFLYWARGMIDGIVGMKDGLSNRNVIKKRTMKIIKSIDSNRPSIGYMLKKKLFQRNFRRPL
jgi:hypothetical protein